MPGPIALVDLLWTGHHPSYFKLFARVLLERGHRLIALCPEPGEIEHWLQEVHPSFAGRWVAVKVEEPRSPPPAGLADAVTQVLARWKSVRSALASCGQPEPALVLFAWLDTLLHPALVRPLMDRVFAHDWTGLYFHPRHLRVAPAGALERFLAARYPAALRARRCRSVFVLDEAIAHALSGSIGGKRVYGLPDVADATPPDASYELARTVRARAAGRVVVAIVGSLAWRKGIMTLVGAARRLPAERYFFLFAGALAESGFPAHELGALRQFAAGRPENCLFHFERIPAEAQFNALICAADILFAAYLDFPHSSNLPSKAAVFRKPLLVSRGHLMAQQVARYRMGLQIDEGDVAQCVAALQALSRPQDAPLPDYEGYSNDHSPRRFAAALGNALDDMGILE